MTQQELRQAYNRHNWQTWLGNIFGSQVQFETQVEKIEIDRDNIKSAKRFASVKLADGKNLAVLDIETGAGIQIARNRVGLRDLVVRFIDHARYHGILAFYHREDVAAQSQYRLSFISSEPTIDVAGNFSLQSTPPKRFTYVLGENEKTKTPADRLKIVAAKNGKATLEDVKNAFSVETLTKEFYKELSDWYFWALQNVDFPNDSGSDREINNSTSVIRLITRLMFVWFLKQKKLIRDELFDRQELESMLNYKDKAGSTFYKAILQNLFFATLNNEMGEKRTFIKRQYGVQNYYRYERFFKNKERFLELTKGTPFLNGGLFENLDKNIGEENEIRIDCFSNRMDKEELLTVPDYLFFGEEKQIDLNKIYDTKGKTCKVRGLIDILKTYNFTVEENTSTDIEVALDPELLGKVFENLLASYNPETQTTARKQTGSFYTPREIVDYMVNESLTAYLQEKVGDDWENNVQTISALNDIKILDPACGSGAFPMGILQKMVQILQKLDPDNKHWREIQKQKAILETEEAYNIGNKEERQKRLLDIDEAFDNNASDYGRKLFLIENCIFGVDIQAIAIQISKLRFFISLICEQAPNSEKPNLGIRPLPNLETKFVAANTLTGLDKTENLFRTQEIINKENELKEVRHRHFSARTPETKRKYREKDHQLRGEIAGILTNLGYAENTAQMLSDWNPYDQNASAPFFDAEWMFGLTGGFDLVIGNPPYVQLQKNGGELSKSYGPKKENKKIIQSPYQTFDSMGDLYSLFYERGYQLLKPQAHLCFITSNKWMRAGYGEKTRKFLVEKTNPVLLLDFPDINVFDKVTVDVNILMYQKDKNRQQMQACIVKKEGIKDLSVYFNQNAERCKFGTESWAILSPVEQRIKAKIEAVGTPLKDWDINIYRGILTGYNEAFIIDGKKKDELIAEDPKNAEIIRPILRGRDIKRYGYDFADLWLINTHNGIKEKGIKPINIDDYPAIKKHLDKYYIELEKRQDKGETPYNLRNCAYIEDFYKQKIVWGNLNLTAAFSFAPEGMFINAPCPLIVPASNYLLAVLNSKLADYYIRNLGVTRNGGYFEYKPMFIEKLPVPLPNNEIDMKIGEIIQAKEYYKIDKIIYDLYKLTEDEIKFIETISCNS